MPELQRIVEALHGNPLIPPVRPDVVGILEHGRHAVGRDPRVAQDYPSVAPGSLPRTMGKPGNWFRTSPSGLTLMAGVEGEGGAGVGGCSVLKLTPVSGARGPIV